MAATRSANRYRAAEVTREKKLVAEHLPHLMTMQRREPMKNA
jgi:hypothetical protein